MTLQTIGILLTAITVSIAAIYYTLTLRYTRRNQELQLETRQAQLFTVLQNRMDTPDFWMKYGNIVYGFEGKTYEEITEMQAERPQQYGDLMSLISFYQHIGWLIKNDLMDIRVVQENMALAVIRVYETTMPFIAEYLRHTGRPPQRYDNFDFLYEEMKKYIHEQQPERISEIKL